MFDSYFKPIHAESKREQIYFSFVCSGKPFAIKLAAFHSAQTEIAFHGFSLRSLTGFRGGLKE